MRTPQRQKGMSIPGMIVIAIVVGFDLFCLVKLVPHYSEYLEVKSIVGQAAAEFQPGKTTLGEVRRRLERLFLTNQVYAIKPGEIEVYREDGVTYLDASYEARVPLFWRLDLVMKFDDLKFEAGKPN